MGSEEPWLLALPCPLALLISLMNFILKGPFGQERKRHRSHECIVPEIVEMKY